MDNIKPSIISVKPQTDIYKKTYSKYAYVFLVMKGDLYIPGAIVAAHSIKKTGTEQDIVCMVTPDVSKIGIKQLEIVFDTIVPVNYIQVKTNNMKSKKIEDRYGVWKSVSYTKWNLLKMIQYNKVIFMDADLVVIDNIDSLFELQTPAGTFSLSQAKPFTKKGIFNPYKTVIHGENVNRKEIDNGFKYFLCIGTSLVLTPNINHFEQYIKMIKQMEPFGFKHCINGPDEQSIVCFYHKILKYRWTHISQIYNMIPWKQKIWMPKGIKKTPFVIHYVSKEKPWMLERNVWEDLSLWWKYADNVEECYSKLEGFCI
jgi:lipopolysaccharide biosynthesis glycosyltransferase